MPAVHPDLICVSASRQLRAWREGTAQLLAEAMSSRPGFVTRDRAVEVFEAHFRVRRLTRLRAGYRTPY